MANNDCIIVNCSWTSLTSHYQIQCKNIFYWKEKMESKKIYVVTLINANVAMWEGSFSNFTSIIWRRWANWLRTKSVSVGIGRATKCENEVSKMFKTSCKIIYIPGILWDWRRINGGLPATSNFSCIAYLWNYYKYST